MAAPMKPLTARRRDRIEEEDAPVSKSAQIGREHPSNDENVNQSTITDSYSINY